MESNNDNNNNDSKKKRKYNSIKRKKILSKIQKIKDKNTLKKILVVVKKDLGNKISNNKNGFFFDMNTLSDKSLETIIDLIKSYNLTDVSDSETKFTYTPYKNNENLSENFGPKLSNKEKNLLKNKK
jgi:hypothetical protein